MSGEQLASDKSRGKYINTNSHEGSGKVKCEDGRTGTFEFVAAGFTGNGAGLIAAQPFVFRIGK